jgi:hypothetical protein
MKWLKNIFKTQNLKEPNSNIMPSVKIFRLVGDNSYSQEIVGESFYQKALEKISGGKNEDGHYLKCIAFLKPEPQNKYDKNAIAVEINDSKVGYLDKRTALKLKNEFKKISGPSWAATCNAVIVGGWYRPEAATDDREGHFGVRIDLTWPLEIS